MAATRRTRARRSRRGARDGTLAARRRRAQPQPRCSRSRSRRGGTAESGILDDVVDEAKTEFAPEIAKVAALKARVDELSASVQSEVTRRQLNGEIDKLNRAMADLSKKVSSFAKDEVADEVSRRPDVDIEALAKQSKRVMDEDGGENAMQLKAAVEQSAPTTRTRSWLKFTNDTSKVVFAGAVTYNVLKLAMYLADPKRRKSDGRTV